ncbi:MAG: hypothetical protein ACRC8D_05930 [Aeromonas sp.]
MNTLFRAVLVGFILTSAAANLLVSASYYHEVKQLRDRVLTLEVLAGSISHTWHE